MHNTLRACIFDLDGTLIDSLADLADAANASLRAAGYPTHATNAYRNFVGNGIKVLIQRALPKAEAQNLDPLRLQTIVDDMSRRYALNWHAKTRCYAGIATLVTQLHEQGLPLAVLSNKPHAFTCEIVDYFFPSHPFHLVYGARPDQPHKPDPTVALHIAQELALPPARVAFIGDSNVDIHTGVRAGMSAIGVCWGFRTREELISAGATALVEQPADIALLLAP
ncbi:MAG: HAD family hydrolase [Desulfovibrionaceae bacterium]